MVEIMTMTVMVGGMVIVVMGHHVLVTVMVGMMTMMEGRVGQASAMVGGLRVGGMIMTKTVPHVTVTTSGQIMEMAVPYMVGGLEMEDPPPSLQQPGARHVPRQVLNHLLRLQHCLGLGMVTIIMAEVEVDGIATVGGMAMVACMVVRAVMVAGIAMVVGMAMVACMVVRAAMVVGIAIAVAITYTIAMSVAIVDTTLVNAEQMPLTTAAVHMAVTIMAEDMEIEIITVVGVQMTIGIKTVECMETITEAVATTMVE